MNIRGVPYKKFKVFVEVKRWSIAMPRSPELAQPDEDIVNPDLETCNITVGEESSTKAWQDAIVMYISDPRPQENQISSQRQPNQESQAIHSVTIVVLFLQIGYASHQFMSPVARGRLPDRQCVSS